MIIMHLVLFAFSKISLMFIICKCIIIMSDRKQNLENTILDDALKKCKKVFWFIFWFSLCINLLALFLPIYTSQVLDRVLSSGSLDTLMVLTIITVVSFIFSSILDSVRYMLMLKINEWLEDKISPEIMKRSIYINCMIPSTSSGQMLRDFSTLRGTLTSNSTLSFFDAPWSLIYLIVLFMINEVIGCVALVGIVLLSGLAFLHDYLTRDIITKNNEENMKNINEIDIATRNSSVLESMGMVNKVVQSWNNKLGINRNYQIKATNRSTIVLSITKTIRSSLHISVIGFGAYFALTIGKSPGSIIAASILLSRTLAPFEASINNLKQISTAKSCYNRLQKILSFEMPLQNMQLPKPIGKLTLEKVFFTPYGSQKPTIKSVSFEINPGQILGVVGPSASGKSTLARLITGVSKTISGHVRLDGAEIAKINKEIFGEYIGYLPQDIELFNSEIKHNISRMDLEADPQEIIKASKAMGIHEYILKFPQGYETNIGSNGLVLSGGQKQLIGLCRAIYGDIKLLVLDEPDANLDSFGRSCLKRIFDHIKQKKITTVIITHNPKLLEEVDIITEIRDGVLVKLINKKDQMQNVRQLSNIQYKIDENIKTN